MVHVTCFKQEINKRGIIKTAKYFVKNICYNKLCLMYKQKYSQKKQKDSLETYAELAVLC